MGDVIVAVDPGRDKCGVAVMATDGTVLHRAVTSPDDVPALAARVVGGRRVRAYAVGDGTGSADMRRGLLAAGVPPERIVLVDEYRSSEIARREYWRHRARKGWRRLVPIGLQTPPEPYDDLVAVELGRRFLEMHSASGERSS